MTRAIATTISEDFYKLAKDNHIKWCEALRVGLSVLFGEKGIRGYDNSLNMSRMIMASRAKAEEALYELVELEKKGSIENANS